MAGVFFCTSLFIGTVLGAEKHLTGLKPLPSSNNNSSRKPFPKDGPPMDGPTPALDGSISDTIRLVSSGGGRPLPDMDRRPIFGKEADAHDHHNHHDHNHNHDHLPIKPKTTLQLPNEDTDLNPHGHGIVPYEEDPAGSPLGDNIVPMGGEMDHHHHDEENHHHFPTESSSDGGHDIDRVEDTEIALWSNGSEYKTIYTNCSFHGLIKALSVYGEESNT